MPDISSSLSKREVNARQNTYTKSEIDLKDGAIQAIAEAAQTTADAAEKKNQGQDQLIAELQEKTDGLQETPTTLWLNNFIDVQMPSCGGRAIAAATIRASRSMTASEPSTRQWAVLRIIDRDTGRLFWKADLDFSFGNGRTIGLTNVADVRKLGNRFALYAAHRYSYDAFCTVAVVVCDATEKGVSSPRLFFSLEYVMPYGEISLNTLDSSSLSSGNWLLLRCEDLSHKHNNIAILNQISAAFTTEDKEKLDDLENRYTKPATGIPKSDLASSVQASLGKADTALQKHQDISGKVDNTTAGADSLLSKITNSWTATPTDNTYFIRQDTSSKNEFGRVKFSTLWSYIKSKVESLGYTKNTGTITGIKMNGASKGTSGVVDLGTVITAHQDISGKQDKSTAVTHTANTAVGSTAKPVYIAADGKATPITHSVNSDVPSNAKFTDTTYSDATQSTHGLMTAADKKKLDGIAAGATKVAVDSALSATSTNPVQNKAVKAALDSKSASGHTHAMITNSMLNIGGANNAASWVRLGTLVSGGDARSALIRVCSGNGFNANAYQNASFEIQIKDGYQSTQSAAKACGVTVYRINCGTVKVKVIPTAHNTYVVWVYLPWGYWNGNYAVYGKYSSWVSQDLRQTTEPEGTAADTAYYDQAFLTSTVAQANTLTDSGWVDVSNFKVDISSFSQITTSFRKYGDIVFIRGRVQPKSNMTSISLCSTTSTSLTGITPNHSVKGVGVSTDGLTPFMVNITTSPANSVILKGNFSANKIYDFEFSYIK